MSAEQAERFAALYDLDTPHGPDPAIDWFRAIARRTGGPVLELGCGTGRVAIPLAQDGHDVVGLDRSEAMLARRAPRATRGECPALVEGDCGRSRSQVVPLIAIAFNPFSSCSPAGARGCLARVREHLAPPASSAIDCFSPTERIVGHDNTVRAGVDASTIRSGRAVTSSPARARTWTTSISVGGSRKLDDDGKSRAGSARKRCTTCIGAKPSSCFRRRLRHRRRCTATTTDRRTGPRRSSSSSRAGASEAPVASAGGDRPPHSRRARRRWDRWAGGARRCGRDRRPHHRCWGRGWSARNANDRRARSRGGARIHRHPLARRQQRLRQRRVRERAPHGRDARRLR